MHDAHGSQHEGGQEPGPTDRLDELWMRLQDWAKALGFSQIGVADVDLDTAEPGWRAWLEAGFHGSMHYMAAHGRMRVAPADLVPGTVRVITAAMDYLPRDTTAVGRSQPPPSAQTRARAPWQDAEIERQHRPGEAVVSIYARGRDYHKVLRQRLQALADRLAQAIGPFGHRVFTDSAPVLEVELAQRSGLGWRGKHTLLLARDGGSMRFLGEIFIDLPLPLTTSVSAHCGSCNACLEACPTRAIVAPYRLDARRCISYLTIEQDGPIPLEFRRALGNRIHGCDDCQLVCPWNRWAHASSLPDFDARSPLTGASLLALWAWSDEEFLRRTEGSAVRRIGAVRWRRNLAVALGNAWRETGDPAIAAALRSALPKADALLAEHLSWALAQR